jgi:Na+-transporting methylmalonyl-CoA/oxaloacetate decarboxylase gamma subunit
MSVLLYFCFIEIIVYLIKLITASTVSFCGEEVELTSSAPVRVVTATTAADVITVATAASAEISTPMVRDKGENDGLRRAFWTVSRMTLASTQCRI